VEVMNQPVIGHLLLVARIRSHVGIVGSPVAPNQCRLSIVTSTRSLKGVDGAPTSPWPVPPSVGKHCVVFRHGRSPVTEFVTLGIWKACKWKLVHGATRAASFGSPWYYDKRACTCVVQSRAKAQGWVPTVVVIRNSQ